MPPRSDPDGAPTIVFGDLHGTSCSPDLLAAAIETSVGLGFRHACNKPYAGGYIARRHGRPAAGIHALQIEIDRSDYLDRELRSPGPGFAAACGLIAAIVRSLETRLLESQLPMAAE